MTDNKWCGNFKNHGPHEVETGLWDKYHCDGVGVEAVSDEIVEKYDPTVDAAMDGTSYVKVKIFIENPKTGETTIISCDKASREMFEVEHQKYVSIDYATRDFHPQIERAIFSFSPYNSDEGPAFAISKEKTHDE